MKFTTVLSGAILAITAYGQQTAYQQCGGIGWTGGTTCIAGWTCIVSNPYYSQCLQSTQQPTTSVSTHPSTTMVTSKKTTSTSVTSIAKPSTTSSTSVPTSPAGGWKWLGVDESGAEFGTPSYPGTYGKDFTFASLTSLDTLMSSGYNIFRLPFAMERMALGSVSGAFSPAYLANYTVAVNHITAKGGWAIVDPHNFGRYNGAIITDTNAFQSFWKTLAASFKSNDHVIFDTNNEYHDMDQTLVLNLNQAAINGIRAAGATSQYIFVEGNSYSGAWTWTAVNDNLKALTDSSSKLIYEMHQYLDSDGSGTSTVCVSSTIGAERIASATTWLRANGKKGIIGEFAAGANAVCKQAVQGMMTSLKANNDVWMGALWWGGGPWWGNYIYSFEPPSGTGYQYFNTLLTGYAP